MPKRISALNVVEGSARRQSAEGQGADTVRTLARDDDIAHGDGGTTDCLGGRHSNQVHVESVVGGDWSLCPPDSTHTSLEQTGVLLASVMTNLRPNAVVVVLCCEELS